MRFYIYGASFADNVYGLIDSYEQSPLHKLTNKDDIKVIETTLKTNNIIPSWVTMRTRSQKGGKYRVLLLSFHLIMPSHTKSCIGENSSIKYMTTGIAGNGRTKEDINADKSRGGKEGGSKNLGCQNIDKPIMLLEFVSSTVVPNAPLVKKFSRNHADIADVLLTNEFFKSASSTQKERIREYKEAANKSGDKSHQFTTKKKGLRPDSARRATDWWRLSLHESEESVMVFAPEATRVTTDERKVSESYREGLRTKSYY